MEKIEHLISELGRHLFNDSEDQRKISLLILGRIRFHLISLELMERKLKVFSEIFIKASRKKVWDSEDKEEILIEVIEFFKELKDETQGTQLRL